jgi:hypothetical protein
LVSWFPISYILHSEKENYIFSADFRLSFSQQKSLTIKDLPPKSEDSVFPLISYAVDSRVENKINTFLQVDQLEYIPGSTQTHLSLFLQENFLFQLCLFL